MVVLGTTLLALVAAGLYAESRTTDYEATSNVLVAPLSSEDETFQNMPLIRESSDGSRPVQTAAGLLSGAALARLTAARLGDDWTTSEVEGAVAVQPRGESNLVAIVARDTDAAQAARIANVYTATALAHRRQTLEPYFERELEVIGEEAEGGERAEELRAAQATGDPTLAVALRAEAPGDAAGPSTALILLVALVVGFLLGVGALMVLDVVRAPPIADG